MASRATPGRVVLVGTYKGDQLTEWRGWYNYSISDKDKIAVADAAIETATNGVDSLGGPRSVAATYDGRDRARPSLMQIKSFNCRSNKITELWLFKGAKDERRCKAEFVGVKTRKDPDLAKRLPEIIVKLRPDQLRVCESTVQMELFSWDKLQPVHLPKQGEFTAVELFAGAGGLSIGLERAGIHVVIANEIMPDFAATLAANHPDTDVVTEAIYILEAA